MNRLIKLDELKISLIKKRELFNKLYQLKLIFDAQANKKINKNN